MVMDELSKNHGVLWSNTVLNWLKKNGDLGISKYSNSKFMSNLFP